ncbi:hypothetical protein RAD15_22995 [Bradyrhizobium sp. 14AA]
MISFLQTRTLFTIAVCLAVAIFAFLEVTEAFQGPAYKDVWLFSRYVLGIPAALVIAIYIAWRAIPVLQQMTFPYLGGHWVGELRFGAGDQDFREATLIIRHRLGGMTLVLDTEESTSTTLAVVATRDSTGTQYHVYYVFENRRKPQYIKPGYPILYRGVAIMKVGMASPMTLSGEYFTDQPTKGVAQFRLQKQSWL